MKEKLIKTERDSNIELLRVAAMLMIIAYHIWVIGVFALGAFVYFAFQISGRIIQKCRPFFMKE